MTRRENLDLKAAQCGLAIATWNPDGFIRYRFYNKDLEPSPDYHNSDNPIYTVSGIRDAHTWINGFRSALHRHGLLVQVETGKE